MTHNESNYAPASPARDRGLFPEREARHYLLMEITRRPTLPAPEWAFRD